MASVEAIVMPAPGLPLEARLFPEPVPEPGGAVLEMLASEVCGTDVHLHHGRLAGVPYPIIPGHVNCGRVLETNGPVLDVEGRPVVTMCGHGERAVTAASLLERAGHGAVAVLTGGPPEWADATGLALESTA